MSGGVDSSVTAALLAAQGYEVLGVSLRLWEGAGERGPRNCSDYRGAGEVAELLGIPHALVDLRSEFMRAVVEPLARSYLGGRTPNPCVACNRDFKIAVLLRWADEHDADYVATGHYARILPNPSTQTPSLLRGVDREKDQSYFLFSLSQEQLARLLFPVGGMTKGEVRESARGFDLPVADRPDSQDICLGDYRDLVESLAQDEERASGEMVDQDGRVLGHHRGIHRFTIGQRKGLGLTAPEPLYVLGIDGDSKRVVVGGRAGLDCHGLIAHSAQWIEPPADEEVPAEIQVRYRAPAVPCRVRFLPENKFEAHFDRPFRAVTPGQAAVLYQGERVLGGGWIEKAISKEAVSNQLKTLG